MSLSFSSFSWTRTSNTGKLMRAAQCKDSDKKPVGNFLGHFKAPRRSQSSASSYRPAAETAEGNVCQRTPPSTALSQSAKSPLLGISVCRPTAGTGGPEARARAPSCCSTAVPTGKNWHEGRGGIFKSAQQTPAHVDLHIRVGAPWGQGQQVGEYNLSRRPGKGNCLLGFPAWCIRRPLW